MKQIFLALALFWITPSLASDSSMLVGNAGEGIVFEGKLYLRDLLEFGVYENPYIGTHLNPQILEALKSHPTLPLLPLDLELLARKITDLNELSPRLGFYVLAAIKAHRWILYAPPLKPFPDDGTFVDLERVPLANRFQFNIRLQKGRFENLPESHKVALIVHESVSSFQSVTFVKNYSVIDSHRLREAVAVMFSDWSDRKQVIEDYLSNYSEIPPRYVREDYPYGDLFAPEHMSTAGFQTPPPTSYTQYNLVFGASDPRSPHLEEVIKKHLKKGYPIYKKRSR